MHRRFVSVGLGVLAAAMVASSAVAAAPKVSAKAAPKPTAQAAPSADATKDATKSIHIPFKQFILDNGLHLIVSEDHSAPTYSISVTYNVGSRDERPGRTGFAHLFEHMMFQGSANVGKGEHFIYILNNGGSANGTTNADRTNYFETLP